VAEVISIAKKPPGAFTSVETIPPPELNVEEEATLVRAELPKTALPLVEPTPLTEVAMVEHTPVRLEHPKHNNTSLRAELDLLEQSLTALEQELAEIKQERDRVNSLAVRLQNIVGTLRQ